MKLQVTGIEFMGADDVVVATIGMDGDTLVIKTIEGLKIRAKPVYNCSRKTPACSWTAPP